MANIYTMTDTWNNAGTVFSAIKMDVTDTASSGSSSLLDLQVGGTSKFKARKDGALTLGSGSAGGQICPGSSETLEFYNLAGTSYAPIRVRGIFTTWATARTSDISALNISEGWDNAAVAFTGIKLNVTNTSSDALSKLMDLQIDGASKFGVSKSGHIFMGQGDLTAVDKGFEVYRYANGANYQRMYFGYSGDVGIINYYVGGTGVLDDFRIQYNNNTKLRLRAEGVNIVTSASQTPVNNLDLCFEGTSDTVLTAKLKGSDGTVRGAKIPLVVSPFDPPLGSGGGGNVTISTSEPSGGSDGDVWYQVPA